LNFDIPVAQHWFNLPPRDPFLTEDTLFLAYLHQPNAATLSLKPLVKEWLGIEPEERDDLYRWIVRNVPECRSIKQAGAYICRAPGELVGRYAKADCRQAWALYEYVRPLVLPDMQEPYDRERRLSPVIVGMQVGGVRCSVERLRTDALAATEKLHELDAQVRRMLSAPHLKVDSNDELVAALSAKGFNGFLRTEKGALSASKDSLDKALAEVPELRRVLGARNHLSTLTGTFMHPWLEFAGQNNGRIHASYNQVKNPEGYGTRTGRLSSSKPNFQNVPGPLGPGLPLMRSYLLPEIGHVWSCADFKAQEPRIAAHFEDGQLMEAFLADPDMDPYIFVLELVGGGVIRKESKVIFLGLLYAMGAATLAAKLDSTADRASMLRNIIRAQLPDIVALDQECKRRFKMGMPIKTLGGRFYFCEPPSHGRDWSYKALNTLIQGSAADQTKEAMIYINDHLEGDERIVNTVHDEISVSHPPERTEDIRRIFHEAANALPCDVPMRMDVRTGNNFAEASKE
jgi:DNA polymerase-1